MQTISLTVNSRRVDAYEHLADYLRQIEIISWCITPNGFFLVGCSMYANDVFVAFLVVKPINFFKREHVNGIAPVIGGVDTRMNKIGAGGYTLNTTFWLDGQNVIVWLAYIFVIIVVTI